MGHSSRSKVPSSLPGQQGASFDLSICFRTFLWSKSWFWYRPCGLVNLSSTACLFVPSLFPILPNDNSNGNNQRNQISRSLPTFNSFVSPADQNTEYQRGKPHDKPGRQLNHYPPTTDSNRKPTNCHDQSCGENNPRTPQAITHGSPSNEDDKDGTRKSPRVSTCVCV